MRNRSKNVPGQRKARGDGKGFHLLRTSKDISVAGSRPARGRDVGEEGKDYSGPKTVTGDRFYLHVQ